MGPPVARALRELGHHAELLDSSVFRAGWDLLDTIASGEEDRAPLLGELTNLLGRAVVANARATNAQLVLFLAQAPGTVEALRALRRHGIATAIWFVEDGELADYWRRIAPEYDVFFHIQTAEFGRRLREAGARHVHYLPVAADPEVHRPVQLSDEQRARYGSDISHMGAGYRNRRRFFLNLLDCQFKLWGSDWDGAPGLRGVLQENGRRVDTGETVLIYNASRINLNLHSSSYTDGVNPHGDFVNPRTFEIAACGGFQLVDRRSLLPDLFTEGEEVAVFDDVASCRAQIDHFLAHPDQARRIAEAGRERVLAQHTYRHRMEEALHVIREHAPLRPPRANGNTVRELVAASETDPELARFFSTLGGPGDVLNLEGVAETIRHREGELSEMEALFLLMNEFRQAASEKGLG